MPDESPRLLADLNALLEYVGDRGVPLTDTGRLRLADVRAINAQFAEPDELDQRLGERTYRIRSEDDAGRVHFLRLVAQAAAVVDARRGRLQRTARATPFARLAADDAMRALFVAWWWKGAWDLLVMPGAPALALMRDRVATAQVLLDLGTETRAIAALGARIRDTVAPTVPASTGFMLDDAAWGYAAWNVGLRPLEAFGGAVATNAVETINGHAFEHLGAVALTAHGAALLRAALEARPAAPPRVRRGMRSPYPTPRPSDLDDEALTAWVEGELRQRVLREHPEYRDAIERGIERVGEVNPRVHLVLHEGIESQLAANDPPDVRRHYERLVALGHDPHEVKHSLANAIAREIWAAQRDERPFDNAHYLARLAALPELAAGDEDEAEEEVRLPPATLSPTKRRELLALPRTSATWEGDLSDLPVDVANMGSPVIAMWVDVGTGVVRALLTRFDAEPGAFALAAFADAALRPKDARPELPARVRVHPELATALRPALRVIGITVEAAEELPVVHGSMDSLARYLAEPEPIARHAGRRRRGRQRRRH